MSRGEKIGYTFACLVLVVGGSFMRSQLLNWIVGPAVVIHSVALATKIFDNDERPSKDGERT